MNHLLKCDRAPFAAMLHGDKTFEFRKNDREYAVGDVLTIEEWDVAPDVNGKVPSGRRLFVEVTYILRGPVYGVPIGYCVMAIKER